MSTDLNRARVRDDVLRTYLTTHQRIGVAVVQRATRMLDRADEPIASALHRFRDDVEAEQAWLIGLMTAMQLPTTAALTSGTLTAETVYTLMRTRRQSVRPALSPAIDIETLTRSVIAKVALWQTLSDLAEVLPVDRERLVMLQRNTRRQLEDLEMAHQFSRQDIFIA